MEKVFREYIYSKVSKLLASYPQFKFEKKIKLGNQRPGSYVWRWAACADLSCFIVIEFEPARDNTNIGIGWSKNPGGLLDFLNTHEATRKFLDNNNDDLDKLWSHDEVYLYKDAFGHQLGFFDSFNDLAPSDYAKKVYSDSEILMRADDKRKYNEIDWDNEKTLRYWGIITCFAKEPLSEAESEFATGKLYREMIEFIEKIGLPYLNNVAKKLCK